MDQLTVFDGTKRVRRKMGKKKKIPMFEDAGCSNPHCYDGQIIYSGETELSVTSWHRCDCTRVKTKEYKEFLAIPSKEIDKMTVKEYRELTERFYDNYDDLKEGSNETDRSW